MKICEQHSRVDAGGVCLICLMEEREKLKTELSAANATIAMLNAALKDAVEEYKKLPHSLGYTLTHGQRWERMIANTQAAADAYMAEEKAKALENAVSNIETMNAQMKISIPDVVDALQQMVDDLRASANRKDE